MLTQDNSESESLSDSLSRRASNSPYAHWFGIRVVSADQDLARVKMQVSSHHLNKFGRGHGGVCLSLADHACGALLAAIATDMFYATVTLNSAFFLPVEEGELLATSKIISRTKSTAHIEAEVTQKGKLLFKASGSFAIRPKRS